MLGLAALMLVVGELLGGRSGLLMGLGFAVFSNIFAYFFSDKIVLAIYRAKPITEIAHPRLWAIVRELVQKANIPMPRLYMIPGAWANAFATGRNPQHAAVAVTRGIADLLSERELKGVLAHELAHVFHRDILVATIAAVLSSTIYTLARIAQWGLYFGGSSNREDRRGGNPLALLVVAIVAPLAALIIQMAISRSREYDADEKGSLWTNDPLALVSALQKIHQAARVIPGAASPTTAHLFIINPFRGENILSLFSTHPPLTRRIARLEAIAGKMGLSAKIYSVPKIIY